MSSAGIVAHGFGFSAASIVARGFAYSPTLPDPPPTGYQYQDSDGTLPGSEPPNVSFGDNSSPHVANHDVYAVALRTLPNNHPVLVAANGAPTITTGGDQTRNSIAYAIYRAATSQFDPLGFPAVTALAYDHETAPIWTARITLGIEGGDPLVVGQPIVPIPLVPAFVSSASGDHLTITLGPGFPPGLFINASNELDGTPTFAGLYNFPLYAMDITGTIGTSLTNEIAVNDVVIPSLGPISSVRLTLETDQTRLFFRTQ